MFIPKKCIVDRREIRAALFPTETSHIIKDRNQNDFYKALMGAYFFKYHPDVSVTYQLFNRSTGIRLADEIKPEDFQRELDHVAKLRYSKKGIAYLSNARNDGKFMFSDDYIEAMENSVLPPYTFDVRDGQFDFKTEGIWHDAKDWEIYGLTILSALRTEALMKKMNRQEQDAVVEYTARQIEEYVHTLQQHPRVTFSCFATRRAASPMLQYIIDRTMLEYLPRGQFLGTSNTWFAQLLDTMPIGTNAHELPMVTAALTNSDDELRESPIKVLHRWWDLYGRNLSIILPDAFGSNWMFKYLPKEFAVDWKGMRQDSMKINEFGEKQIAFYKKFGQDPREHMMIPSDGLTLDSMIKATYDFINRIGITSGWGTHLGNNTGLGHPSIVIKAILAWLGNGPKKPCVKLTDNLAKGIGVPDEKDRYARVFEYKKLYPETYSKDCAC